MNTLQNKSSGDPGSRRSFLKRTLLVRFKLVLCTVLLILAIGNQKIFGQGVGISESAPITPNASSILELQSTSKGFLAPRMSTAQRTGLVSPAPGLLVYDTDTKSFWYWDSGWKAVTSATIAWGAANQLLGMNAAADANEYKTLNGSSNINVTHAANSITLNTIQNITTSSSPTFAGLTLTSPLTVPNGGTGLTSGISGGIPYFNTSTSMASSALLTANGVVIGGGAGIAPFTITPGTNNTVLRGSTGGAPSFGQIVNSDIAAGTIDLTSKVTGVLPLANGGTNANLTASASNGGIVWSNASQMQILAGTATANKILLSGVSSSPAWSSYSMPFSFAGAGEVLYTSNATTLSSLPAGTTGMYLKSNGSAAPAWQRISLSSAAEVMNVLPTANGGTNSGAALSGSSIIVSDGVSILQGAKGTTTTVLHGNASGLPSYSAVDLAFDVTNVLPVANGGTGSNTQNWVDLTTNQTVIGIKTWNSLGIFTAGLTASGGAVNLNNNSNFATNINTGSSTANVTIGGAGNSLYLPKFTTAGILHNDGTGLVTSGPVSLTTDLNGILPVPNGGTGVTTLANHGIVIGHGINPVAVTATGTAGQVLQSGGSLADPLYSAAIYPSATTVNQILYSSSSDNITGLATGNNGVLITSGAGVPSISSTLPNAVQDNITRLGTITSGVWNGTILGLAYGGTNTNLSAGGATGDLLYANAPTTFARLADIATGNVLISGGLGAAPLWGKVGLTSHVSGVLPIANGGTNSSTALVNGRVMISKAGKIVEAGVMNNGQVIVGSTGLEPQIVTMGGDVSINNLGATTVGFVGTSTALNVHTAELSANAATELNTASTIVKRDASGNFIAGTITATLNGNASTVTTNANLIGDVTSIGNATTLATVNTTTPGTYGTGTTVPMITVNGKGLVTASSSTAIVFPVTLAGAETLTNKTIISPLGLVKGDVGLGNVDNTSDLNKPISTATQAALNFKEDLANKSLDVTTDGSSDVKYPSVKAIKNYVDAVVVTATPDATALIKGKIKLAGDLSGTADLPTVATVGGSTALNVHSAELSANAATELNTASTIVKRDASGNFTAGTITAALNGNASTVTTNANLTGDVTSIGNATTLATVNTTTPGTYGTGTTVPTITVTGKGLVTASSSTAIAFPVTLAGAETLTNKTIISPLGLVKGDVGLGNVDNTSDLNKPISTATQAALNFKEDLANKSLDVTTDGGSDLKYPSVKATKTYVDAAIVTATPDATTLIKGKVKLAGDLSGTADLPTVATVGGSTALNVHSAELSANAATELNTAGTIVKRDASGNFTAGIITAALNGNATTATSATSATTAGTANNLLGGAGGSIPYQSAASTTALLGNGTAGQVLTSNGTTLAPSWTNPTNGTVTSVGLSLPAFITVTSSPVTGSGTLTGTLASQSANTVFAAPNGSAGAPTFRALVTADIPNIAESQVTNLVTDLSNRALTSTTVNGHALSSNVVISASDITTGTLPHAQLPALVSGDVPNNAANTSGNAATATSLATRAIYGNNFNGTTDVTGIIASNYGGTGNGFTKFSGPAGAEKIFTLPNANATILTSNAAVTVVQGGTGATTLTSHGVMIGNGTSAVNVIGAGTAGQILQSGGAGSDPSWSTAIYPSTAGSAGSLLVSNGTNFTSTGLSTNTMALGSDVTLTLANTFYTGPSMSLGAGTWFITGTVTLYSTSGVMGSAAARLMNGATVITSSESYLRSGNNLTSITLSGFVTLAGSTTIFIEAAFNQTGGFIRANTVIGATTNASFMNAVRVGP